MPEMITAQTITVPTHGGHDPDGENTNRANWAEGMIQEIITCTGTDRDNALRDGLAGLMHWAHREGFDFGNELRVACNFFRDETREDGGWTRPDSKPQLDLDAALERWQVHEPGMWENDTGPEGWHAVSNDDGIVAYFGDPADAYRHRITMINRDLNP
ncbi:hypothetical protein SAMN04488527_15719 [Aliiroseovarius crassostreae]|uniref:Uncharacterized protein n=1 Tax=Aliiroseovarius crassostreae TaxID=154981 RepID=A0A0P7J534_9RHOB|nr:hypothetical protein [Aliiroseovarius crassostreae]KPN62991.1 hypothetical protein AKJ29_02250 [Aliiroseovarius crassostreae]SFU96770.1 hypothetical protein SAMN04488527_15719 [Aliiroseovarius crassostreae]